jgi:hypothetical protein
MTAEILAPDYGAEPRIQYEAMELLLQNLGPKVSRDVIERAVCEIDGRLGTLQEALFEGELGPVRTIALRLTAISRQIGLVGFSDVATDLVRCIDRCDITATYAVAERLIRLGESSMFQAVQFAGMSGA